MIYTSSTKRYHVHGVNMGTTWVLSAPNGPLVGPINLAIRVMTTGPARNPCEASDFKADILAAKLFCLLEFKSTILLRSISKSMLQGIRYSLKHYIAENFLWNGKLWHFFSNLTAIIMLAHHTTTSYFQKSKNCSIICNWRFIYLSLKVVLCHRRVFIFQMTVTPMNSNFVQWHMHVKKTNGV